MGRKTSAKWSHLALRTTAEPGFTWCVPAACVCVFGSAETLANPLCASQCPVSEELWPLSSCSLLKPQKKMRELRECKWASVCAKTSPGGHTVRSEAHRGACSTVHALAYAQHTLAVVRMRTRAARLDSIYAVQGFSWVSDDLAVTTFLLKLESRGVRVQYIWLNRLQVRTSTVTTCLKQLFAICATVWYSDSLLYCNCLINSLLGCECY